MAIAPGEADHDLVVGPRAHLAQAPLAGRSSHEMRPACSSSATCIAHVDGRDPEVEGDAVDGHDAVPEVAEDPEPRLARERLDTRGLDCPPRSRRCGCSASGRTGQALFRVIQLFLSNATACR